MKTKLEIANEWMMKHDDGSMSVEVVVFRAWQYADTMQAEADKREKEEAAQWQPDWSQAPEWANWWAMDENKNTRWIYSELEQPYISDMFLMWFAIGRYSRADAPSFGYTGDWRNSLRKRPK